MNHRKLHLLKPTVYSYPHSNPWLVKTELIYCRLYQHSVLPEAHLARGAGPREGRDRTSQTSVSPPPLPLGFWVSTLGFLQYNPESHFSEMTVSNLWQNILLLPTQMPAAAGGWHPGQCEPRGWGVWMNEERSPSLRVAFPSLPPSLLPSLPWLFFFLAISSVGPLWNGLALYQD